MIRTVAVLLAAAALSPAINIGLGLHSGMSLPVSIPESAEYDPSVFIEPSVYLGDANPWFHFSYGHVFARGRELQQAPYQSGDEFANYRTSIHYGTLLLIRDLGFVQAGLSALFR